jgi:hypothetical protein
MQADQILKLYLEIPSQLLGLIKGKKSGSEVSFFVF